MSKAITPLQKKILKDMADVQNRAEAMFQVYMHQVGYIIEHFGNDVVQTVASVILHHDELNFNQLLANRIVDKLTDVLIVRADACANQIIDQWNEVSNDFDILSRFAIAMIARKTQPPWVSAKIDLKKQISTDAIDPRKGHIHFYLRNIVTMIMQDLQQAAVSKKTPTEALRIIRGRFRSDRKMGSRNRMFESARGPFDPSFRDFSDFDDQVKTTFGSAAWEMIEGVYTQEQIESFLTRQQQAMQWDHRQYRPWFTDEIKANNRFLRDLEQLLGYDAVTQLHSGMLQIGSEQMGIEDFEWVATKPRTCDCCADRDGLTMKEIKAKFNDQYGDDPPPLHPNCRCSLVPKISDSWGSDVLKQKGFKWDPRNGEASYVATDTEKKYGIQDMSLDDFMNKFGR